jgi:hypothetical protein
MTFDWNANWPFLLQVTLLGMGLQKPLSKWIPNSFSLRLLYLLDNDVTRVVLTQPFRRRMKRFTLWSPWPSIERFYMKTALSFFRLRLPGMGLQQPISKWIQNGWALRLLYLLDNDVLFSPNLYITELTVLHEMFPATLNLHVCRLNFTMVK